MGRDGNATAAWVLAAIVLGVTVPGLIAYMLGIQPFDPEYIRAVYF